MGCWESEKALVLMPGFLSSEGEAERYRRI
jgi:hypothetical protein